MKLKRLISLVLTVLMIIGASTVCLTANAAEVETVETGAYGSYYNVNYLENKAYNGTDLGCTYTPAKTTWKVWSPEAKSVKLNLYATGSDLENGAKNLGTYTMDKNNTTGVFTVALDGDYKNVYYTYTVDTAKLGAMETYDIYATACGVNGNRSMVVDLDSTDPEGWENDQHVFQDQMTDEAIWEVHIADLTSSDTSGVSPEYEGKFLGFVEGGLKYKGKSVGVDYLVEQGIKAVHIQCPFDFASGDERNNESYNWGYDPKNYNVPEGLYSTNPYDGNVRITEFKQLVQALHDRGISVIMGVVYNHTFGSDKSPFTYTVPGYYYRMESATQYNNCTACGNTLASDKKMFRSYMKQSLKFWAEEYHIDGFRFDLMAAHDWQVMNEIRDMFNGMYGGEGKKIIMYGEPWTGTGGDPGIYASNACTINNASKLKENIGCFNDTTRNAIQSWFKSEAAANTGTVKAGITSTTKSGLVPNKSLTYFDCHDGVTWWDNIMSVNGKQYDSTNAAHRLKLRTSMTYLFTSQGVPFMLAGTEFARTKYGNSYNAGDTNAFDWKRIETYGAEVAYVKGLREIRNAFSPFRSSSKVTNPSYLSTGNNIIAYTLNNTKAGEWSKALVIVNNGAAGSVTLPAGSWSIVADGEKAGLTSLGTASGSYNVPANGSAVLVQGETTAKSATYETVTVNHVVGGKTIKTTESLYAVGDTWRAVPDNYTIFNHNVVSIESNAGTKLGNTYYGTVEAGKDVVVTITYEAFNTDGYLTIKYVDEKGNSVSNDITFRMLNGEEFNLPFSNVSGYELVSSKYPANYKGTFDSANPETITFVYKQLDVKSIDVYYYNTKWSTVGMYAYTDNEDKPLGTWGAKAQLMTKVTNASELPKGETVGRWYKKSITDANSQLDYHITSCNVMFHNMGQGEQEPLNGEPGYVASGTVYVKNKVLSFNTDIVVSHIDAETGKKLAEDERISFTNVSLKDTYETKAKEGLGEAIVPTNAKGNVLAGSICVVYLYGDKKVEPTTAPTEPASSAAPTTAPTEPAGTTAPTTAPATTPKETDPATTPAASTPVATTAPVATTTAPVATTTTPKETVTNPGEFIDPLILGDSDLSGVVNIKDATLIQKHAANMLSLIGDGAICADAYTDEKINIKDATIIQKFLAKMDIDYAVGETIPGTGEWVTFPVTTSATTAAPVTTKATEAATTAEPTEATTVASTPAATTVPVTTTKATEAPTAEPTTQEPTVTVEPTTETPVVTDPVEPPTEIVTDPPEDPYDPPVYDTYFVCFSNNKRWAGEIYAYCWDGVGGTNGEWPGVPMTYLDTNDYGEDRYTYEVPAGLTNIIFTNNEGKSVDIDLTMQTDFGFYLLDTQVEDGGYDIGVYPYI